MTSAEGRYLAYLRTFGIEQPGPRVVEHASLAIGRFRAYSLNSATSGPYRAFAADDGLVASGRRANDAWHAFLGAGSAHEAAGRIAWLESTDPGGPHHPASGVMLVPSGVALPFPADPALRERVTTPNCSEAADGTRTLAAWYVRAGGDALERWRINAPFRGPAAFVVQSYDRQAVATDADPRARTMLASPRADERLWAIGVLTARTNSAAAATVQPELIPLLRDTDAGVREAVATALGRIGDPLAVGPLADACERSRDPGERRHFVQVLAAFGDASLDVLDRLSGTEPSTDVRLEIVHVLGRIDTPAARSLLSGMARDPDESVRKLAATYLAIAR